jgi:tRNA dimethylallyltransferase
MTELMRHRTLFTDINNGTEFAMNRTRTNKVIILLGPTGVGKSGVSLLLAKALDTEIISADAMQIYRHMDIGTAKPTVEERTLIKHHMIDIVDPWESYSTGRYIGTVAPIIEELHSKRKIPIIVGGTGLYIKAMTRGIFSGPSADWSLRQNLLSMEEEEKGFLYRLLKDLDQEASHRITPNDTRRLVRAIEVCLKVESNMSDMQKRMTKPFPYEFIKIGLSRDRKELYRIIEQRVDEMVSKGLVEEVKNVIGMIFPSPILRFTALPLPSMQAIGYKEVILHLEGKITLEEAIRLIKKGSKRYAKRQFTWFRREESIHWIDITGIYDHGMIVNLISDVLSHIQKH